MADQFVRVRLSRIEPLDLNLFDFDYDLTMMIFFLDPEQRVYARYGGRDSTSAEDRQSLAGLQHAMASVLDMHRRDERKFAAPRGDQPLFFRDLPEAGPRGGCLHCHQLKESLIANQKQKGEWNRDLLWRFPPPDNLGLRLSVDESNVVEQVEEGSPAAQAGLRPGDVVERMGEIPIHSFGDAQFALDRVSPDAASVEVEWRRGESRTSAAVSLPANWRRTDLLWRRSIPEYIPNLRLSGEDLTADEKRKLGLPVDRMAFRQKKTVGPASSPIQAGDIVVDIDHRRLRLDAYDVRDYLMRQFVCGETIAISIVRDGKPMEVEVTLAP